MEPYKQLEKEWAKFTGAKHAVSCSSGTAALHLALVALGVGPGDEVIVPDFTMAACAFAVSYTGARPVFCDVDPETYAIQPAEIEKLITPRTKAIMPVHVYGRLAPMIEIMRLAIRYKIPVIEDACEAQGAVRKQLADITCYSFYRNKIIAAEEGGIITTSRKDLADRISYLKNMAFSPAHDYFHEAIGYNYRMSDAMAELALKSLHKYDRNARRRRLIEGWYDSELFGRFSTPPKRDAVWFYEIVAEKKAIKTHPWIRDCFKPISSYPMYGSGPGKPNARALGKKLILLPVRPEMTQRDVKEICKDL